MHLVDDSADPNPIRVLLAGSDSLHRMRLRFACRSDHGLEVVGEASNGEQVADLAAATKPHVILCDARILRDRAVELYARYHKGKNGGIFVLMAPNPHAIEKLGGVPVAATFATDIGAEALHQQLRALMAGTSIAPGPSVAVRAPVERLYDPTEVLTSPPVAVDPPHLGEPVGEMPATPVTGASDASPDVVRERRQHTERRQQPDRRQPAATRFSLETRLLEIQTQYRGVRDDATGLLGSSVLARALHALKEIGHPAAVVVLHVWYTGPIGMAVTTGEEAEVLRAAGAALRATVRPQDMVCRLEGASFAIVLPGVEAKLASQTAERVRSAMKAVQQRHSSAAALLNVAVGVSCWAPSTPSLQPFAAAWRQMAEIRRTHNQPRNSPAQ